MSRKPLRALVLAAGRGERLRPLTAELPKPLLPIAGRPLVAGTLDALVALGCDAIAVNLHHCGAAIAAALGERWRGVPLVYSWESELLGTLGALHPLREFLGAGEELLVVNGDSLCRWPLRSLLRRQRAGAAVATLLLARTVDPRPFDGGVRIDARGRVLAFRSGGLAAAAARRAAVFAGAHVLSSALLARVPPGPSDSVRELYEPLLAEGAAIATVLTARPWHDLGTPERYRAGALAWGLAGLPPGASRRAEEVRVEPTARLSGAVLERAVEVGAGARIVASVLCAGATIGAGATLRGTVVGPRVQVPAGAELVDVLVTTGADGALVTTPIAANH